MPGTLSMPKFLAFCCVFMGIVLFCVVFGGYTSFYRSQNRIQASQIFLTDACKKRQDLVPGLVEMTEKTLLQTEGQKIHKAANTAGLVLEQVIASSSPVDKDLIKEFERTQKELTDQLKRLLSQLDAAVDKKNIQHYNDLKNQFIASQNQLFVAKKHYNDEVNYFKARKAAFFPSMFARLFGFNKIEYTDISRTLFLPAHETFVSSTS